MSPGLLIWRGHKPHALLLYIVGLAMGPVHRNVGVFGKLRRKLPKGVTDGPGLLPNAEPGLVIRDSVRLRVLLAQVDGLDVLLYFPATKENVL